MSGERKIAIHVRVSKSNLARLRAMAKTAKMSQSSFVDRVIEVHYKVAEQAREAADKAQVAAVAASMAA